MFEGCSVFVQVYEQEEPVVHVTNRCDSHKEEKLTGATATDRPSPCVVNTEASTLGATAICLCVYIYIQVYYVDKARLYHSNWRQPTAIEGIVEQMTPSSNLTGHKLRHTILYIRWQLKPRCCRVMPSQIRV